MRRKLCFGRASIHSRRRRNSHQHESRVFINRFSMCCAMRSQTARHRESISSSPMDFLTAKRLKDSGRCMNARASPASTAERRFAERRTAADPLTGVLSVRGGENQHGNLRSYSVCASVNCSQSLLDSMIHPSERTGTRLHQLHVD